MSQLWEEKKYCERRNVLSSWRPVALPNRHKHLCLFKLGYDMHALLSSVMYILSGKKITAVYPMSRRRWDQNTTQVDNRLNRARATYGRLLHVPPCNIPCNIQRSKVVLLNIHIYSIGYRLFSIKVINVNTYSNHSDRAILQYIHLLYLLSFFLAKFWKCHKQQN